MNIEGTGAVHTSAPPTTSRCRPPYAATAPSASKRAGWGVALCAALCLAILPAARADASVRLSNQPQDSGISLPGLSWSTALAPLPQPLYRAATATVGGRIYDFGGSDGTTDYNTTYIYDPIHNRWTLGAPMPTAREGARAVALPDGRIAVVGGGINCFTDLCSGGTVYANLDVYTPSSNSWMEYPAMLSPRYRFAAVFFHNDIYAMGGSNGSNILFSAEAFDFETQTWTPQPSLPQPLLAPVAAADSAGNIDVVGGTNLTTYYNSMYTFDGTSWHTGPSLPQATEDGGATIGSDGQVYVTGGYTPQTNLLSIVQVFDPRTARWSVTTSLPAPNCCMGLATTPGRIFSVGGYNGVTSISQVAAGTVWPAPTMTVTPNSGAAGISTTVAGSGFGPGHTIQIKLYCSAPSCVSHTVLGTAVADLHGNINILVKIPGATVPGAHEVGAIDTSTNAFAGRTFTATS